MIRTLLLYGVHPRNIHQWCGFTNHALIHIRSTLLAVVLEQNCNITKDPIRKAHLVGSSVVLTLDPRHVRRLGIDEFTFFVQKPVEEGILLQKCKLQFSTTNEGDRI
jgi:hypothetical protein